MATKLPTTTGPKPIDLMPVFDQRPIPNASGFQAGGNGAKKGAPDYGPPTQSGIMGGGGLVNAPGTTSNSAVMPSVQTSAGGVPTDDQVRAYKASLGWKGADLDTDLDAYRNQMRIASENGGNIPTSREYWLNQAQASGNPAQQAQDAMRTALTTGTAIGGGQNLGTGLTGAAYAGMTAEQAQRLANGESEQAVFGPGGAPRTGPEKNAMSFSPGATGGTTVNPGAPSPTPSYNVPPQPGFTSPGFSQPGPGGTNPGYIGTSPNTTGARGVDPTLVTGSGGAGLINTPAASAPGVQATTASSTGYNATGATAAPGVQAGTAQAGTVNAPTANASDWNLDAGQMVQDRIRGIINEDSPLMQQAKTRALQQQNARGTLNSSMAVQAGQAALYDAAMPIAAQDAQTAAQRAQFNAGNQTDVSKFNAAQGLDASKANAQLFTDVSKFNVDNALKAGVINQEQANAIAQFNATQANEAAKFGAASANDMAKFNADALLKAGIINQEQANQMARFNSEQANELAKFELQNDTDIAKFNASESNAIKKLGLDSDTKLEMANIEAGYKTLMQANASASDLYKQMVLNVSNIMSNPNMSSEAKTIAARQQVNMVNQGMSLIGTMSNLELGDLLTWDDVNADGAGPAPEPAPGAPAPAPGGLINAPQPGDYGYNGGF